MTIQIENLVKRYGDFTAVDHLNLHISEGEIFGLLGPNGSGKTTTINCILSLLSYNKGTIKIFGKTMNPNAYDIKKDIGVVMQQVAVIDELTVYENIDYFCGLYITSTKEKKRLVEEALVFAGLEDFRKYYPGKLSGGLLRRLNIACGIAHKPKLIFLDEPTVAVDPQSRNHILDGIIKLNQEGATIVYTTHYMEEVEQICSQIAIMDKGKIIAQGSKEELKALIQTGEIISIEIINGDPLLEAEKLRHLSGILSIDVEAQNLIIKAKPKENCVGSVLTILNQNNILTGQILVTQPTLNNVFLEITGKELRDKE